MFSLIPEGEEEGLLFRYLFLMCLPPRLANLVTPLENHPMWLLANVAALLEILGSWQSRHSPPFGPFYSSRGSSGTTSWKPPAQQKEPPPFGSCSTSHRPPPLLTIPRTGIDIVQLSRLHFWQASYSSPRQLTPVCYNQVQGMLLRGLAPFSLPDWFPLRRHDHPSGDHSMAWSTRPLLPRPLWRHPFSSGCSSPGPWAPSRLLAVLLQAAIPGSMAEQLLQLLCHLVSSLPAGHGAGQPGVPALSTLLFAHAAGILPGFLWYRSHPGCSQFLADLLLCDLILLQSSSTSWRLFSSISAGSNCCSATPLSYRAAPPSL